MRDWRHSLKTFVSLTADSLPYPLLVFKAPPPAAQSWPASLPRVDAVVAFYGISDGGYLGPHFNFLALGDLEQENERWVKILRAWDENGDVLDPERHLVFATDAGGCPVVLDTVQGTVAIFQYDGGTWEPPLASSFEGFLVDLFNQEPDPDDLWSQALGQLDAFI